MVTAPSWCHTPPVPIAYLSYNLDVSTLEDSIEAIYFEFI
jgi:hypothetical protein